MSPGSDMTTWPLWRTYQMVPLLHSGRYSFLLPTTSLVRAVTFAPMALMLRSGTSCLPHAAIIGLTALVRCIMLNYLPHACASCAFSQMHACDKSA